eukprot:965625-Rhodomonas_salina.1
MISLLFDKGMQGKMQGKNHRAKKFCDSGAHKSFATRQKCKLGRIEHRSKGKTGCKSLTQEFESPSSQ